MKTFKEFSFNIIPKGQKMVKVLQSNADEVMVTKDKDGKFNIMYDNQSVDTAKNEREAMKNARQFVQMMNKSGMTGMGTKDIGGKRAGRGGYFK